MTTIYAHEGIQLVWVLAGNLCWPPVRHSALDGDAVACLMLTSSH